MSRKTPIGIIGFGNMGRAIGQALNRGDDWKVYAYDKAFLKLKNLGSIKRSPSCEAAIKNSKIVILAIKPQEMRQFLLREKDNLLKSKPVIISIAAGLPIKFFEDVLPKIKVIRAMPNIGAKLKESVTFLCKGRYASGADLSTAKKIFSQVGEVMAADEKLMDKVTAVSGSGIGYVYFLMDSIYTAARNLKFSKAEARTMVLRVFNAAAGLAKSSNKDFAALIKEVASAGGTTEAALKVFRQKRIPDALFLGIKAAVSRGKEISKVYTKRDRLWKKSE